MKFTPLNTLHRLPGATVAARAIRAAEPSVVLPWAKRTVPSIVDIDVKLGVRFGEHTQNLHHALRRGHGASITQAQRGIANAVSLLRHGTRWESYCQAQLALGIVDASSVTEAFSEQQVVDDVLYGAFELYGTPLASDDVVHFKELIGRVDAMFATLTPRENTVLRLRFGMPLRRGGLMSPAFSMEAVGKICGMTPDSIRQIEAKALRKLRYPSSLKTVKMYAEHSFHTLHEAWKYAPRSAEQVRLQRALDHYLPFHNRNDAQGMLHAMLGFVAFPADRLVALPPLTTHLRLEDVRFVCQDLAYDVDLKNMEQHCDALKALNPWVGVARALSVHRLGARLSQALAAYDASEKFASFPRSHLAVDWDERAAEYFEARLPLNAGLYQLFRDEYSPGLAETVSRALSAMRSNAVLQYDPNDTAQTLALMVWIERNYQLRGNANPIPVLRALLRKSAIAELALRPKELRLSTLAEFLGVVQKARGRRTIKVRSLAELRAAHRAYSRSKPSLDLITSVLTTRNAIGELAVLDYAFQDARVRSALDGVRAPAIKKLMRACKRWASAQTLDSPIATLDRMEQVALYAHVLEGANAGSKDRIPDFEEFVQRVSLAQAAVRKQRIESLRLSDIANGVCALRWSRWWGSTQHQGDVSIYGLVSTTLARAQAPARLPNMLEHVTSMLSSAPDDHATFRKAEVLLAALPENFTALELQIATHLAEAGINADTAKEAGSLVARCDVAVLNAKLNARTSPLIVSYETMSLEDKVAVYLLSAKNVQQTLSFTEFDFLMLIELNQAARDMRMLTHADLASYLRNAKRRQEYFSGALDAVDTVAQAIQAVNPAMSPERTARVLASFARAPRDVRAANVRRLGPSISADHIDAVIDAVDAGLTLNGAEFKQFQALDNRRTVTTQIATRRQELLSGARLGDIEDVVNRLAVRSLVGDRVSSDKVDTILSGAHVAPQDPRVYARPFASQVKIAKAVHANINRGVMRDYIAPIDRIRTRAQLATWLRTLVVNSRGLGLKHLRSTMIRTLGLPKYADLTQAGDKVTSHNAMELLHAIVKTLGKDPQRAVGIQVLPQIMIAWAWHHPGNVHLRTQINALSQNMSAQEIENSLGALLEFYSDVMPDAVRAVAPKLHSAQNFLNNAERRLRQELARIEKLEESNETITFFPSRDRLDALFPFIAENCLSWSLDYALHAMRDGLFMPYRNVMQGQWVGEILTLTGFDQGLKLLMMPGIEPGTNLTVDPDSYLDAVDQGFYAVGLEGAYDLVLLPKDRYAQTSRTATIGPALRKRYTQPFRTRRAFGFPQRDVEGMQHYARHRDFLIMHDLRNRP